LVFPKLGRWDVSVTFPVTDKLAIVEVTIMVLFPVGTTVPPRVIDPPTFTVLPGPVPEIAPVVLTPAIFGKIKLPVIVKTLGVFTASVDPFPTVMELIV